MAASAAAARADGRQTGLVVSPAGVIVRGPRLDGVYGALWPTALAGGSSPTSLCPHGLSRAKDPRKSMAAGDDLAQMAQLVNDLKACFSADSTLSAMYDRPC